MNKILVVLALIMSQNIFAGEEATIKGVVTSGGEKLPGVTIYVKGQKIGTTTSMDGKYTLVIPTGKVSIVISSIGFKTEELSINIKKHETKVIDFELFEDVFGLDQVVVSATKTHLNRKEAPVLVTVTDAKLLNNTKSITLLEGLTFQPGLRTENNCQNCGFSQVRINGLDGAYSQILVNSRPVFSSLNGIYGLEQIPSNMIKQIEVIRGGGSALFGSNAIAGTINIITKDPFENSFQVSSVLGSINGKSTDAMLNFNTTFVSEDMYKGITFFGMYRNRDAYDDNDDSFTEVTKLNNINFGFKSFYSFSERKKLTGEFNTIYELRRGGDQLERPPHLAFIAEQIRNNIVGGGLTYEYLSNSYNHKFSTYSNVQNTISNNYYGVGQDPNGYGLTEDLTAIIGGQHTANFDDFMNGSMELTSGVEYRFSGISEQRENIAVDPLEQDVTTLGVFTQFDWKPIEKLKILTGVRGEYFNSNLMDKSLFILNPRVSLLYNISETVSFRSSYSRGFRAPQFYSEDIHSEIITGEVRRVVLSEDLKSEKSVSYMSSLEYSHVHDDHQLVLTLEGFYTQINNPFVYEDRGMEQELSIKEKINGDRATVTGANVEIKYSPNTDFTFQLGGTYQKGYYANAYEPEEGLLTDRILRTPDLYGNAIVYYKASDHWNFNLTGIFTGKMTVPHLEGYISENRLERTPEMFELGLNADHTFELSKNFEMELNGGVKNLLNAYQDDFDKTIDRDPSYIYGPSQPRTVFIGIKIGTEL